MTYTFMTYAFIKFYLACALFYILIFLAILPVQEFDKDK